MKTLSILALTASLVNAETSAHWVMPITGLKEDSHIEFNLDLEYNLTDSLSASYLGLMDLYTKGGGQHKSHFH